MSGGAWRKAAVRQPVVWQPPEGWVEAVPGVLVPPDYVPSPWELLPSPVVTPEDAIREYARCAAPGGLVYFATHWLWTVHVDDPNGSPTIRRIPSFPYIRRFLSDLDEPQNTHSDKSRQMLTSWLYMAAFLRDLLFRRNWPMFVTSRRASEVDDGGETSTPDSLLGKIRFMHGCLPPFLWSPLYFKYNRVGNTTLRTYVRGETGGGTGAVRGPAARRGLMDEAAYIPRSESAFAGARQACKSGLGMNSTPNGKGNAFARIKFSRTTTFKRVSMHWTEHPEKADGIRCRCGWTMRAGRGMPGDQFAAHRPSCKHPEGPQPTSPWYEKQAADLTDEQIASELEINYTKSTRGLVMDGFDATRDIQEVALLRSRRTGEAIGPPRPKETPEAYTRRVLAHQIDPTKPIGIAWDFGVSDETAAFLMQPTDDASMSTRWLAELVDRNRSWDHYHDYIARVWYPAYLEACGWTPATIIKWRDKMGYDWSDRPALVPDLVDEIPRGCLPVYHAGDPSGRNRDSSLRSWIMNMAHADPSMPIRWVPFGKDAAGGNQKTARRLGSMLDWIDKLRVKVRQGRVRVLDICPRLVNAFEGWRWPTDEEGNPKPGRQLPVHDSHSHPMTAVVYWYRTYWRGRLFDRSDRRDDEVQALLADGAMRSPTRDLNDSLGRDEDDDQ